MCSCMTVPGDNLTQRRGVLLSRRQQAVLGIEVVRGAQQEHAPPARGNSHTGAGTGGEGHGPKACTTAGEAVPCRLVHPRRPSHVQGMQAGALSLTLCWGRSACKQRPPRVPSTYGEGGRPASSTGPTRSAEGATCSALVQCNRQASAQRRHRPPQALTGSPHAAQGWRVHAVPRSTLPPSATGPAAFAAGCLRRRWRHKRRRCACSSGRCRHRQVCPQLGSTNRIITDNNSITGPKLAQRRVAPWLEYQVPAWVAVLTLGIAPQAPVLWRQRRTVANPVDGQNQMPNNACTRLLSHCMG